MAKKVFVSFDWDNDRRYKHLMQAWDKNDNFEFVFDDVSSGEIDSDDVGRVKAALTTKINNASITFVIVGEEANKLHSDSDEIGYRNWINFEVAKSVEAGNGLAAVKLDRSFTSPEELLDQNSSWAMSFNEDAIIKALEDAG